MIRKVLLAFAFVLAVQLVSPAKASADCGGSGEVPCYDWSWCAYTTPSIFGPVCWGGLVPSGSFDGCSSDRLNNWGLVCVDCGAAFQPTCNYGSTCDTDQRYTAVGFCYPCGQSGQAACTTGASCDPGNREIFGFCSASGFSDEPTTNVETMPTLTQPANAPVRGIADLHTHMFSNLGFGGVVFWGEPFDWRGINSALAWCDYTWDFATQWASTGVTGPVTPFGYEIHGPEAFQAVTDPITNALEGQHSVAGDGAFDGWPTSGTYTHQMMYYKWLERAYLGGIRLMVIHMVSNEALCKSGKIRSDFTCDDMDAVNNEIQAAKDLQWAIDWMDDQQFNNSGWFQIAYTPDEARQIIRNGKLAVVLGIEVDSLFDCKPNSTNCDQQYLHDQLAYYYAQGVRHVFPIHQFDNAFGGAALFKNELNAGNIVVTGSHFTVRDCSADGYTFNLEETVTDWLNLLVNGNPLPPQSTYDQSAADCNARGLTDTGTTLINEMMNQHFIIDTDHMSRLMADSVLQIAQTPSGSRQRMYPLVSSHSNFMSKEATKDEFSLTDAQLQIYKQIGGIVTVGNPKGGCDTGYKDQFDFAVTTMQKDGNDQYPGIAFSTDVNGFAGNTAARIGNPGCTNTAGAMPYPFTGIMGGTFDRQVTGQRTFDFNTDGEAHYGLLADFFADLTYGGGMTTAELDPLLNSAETYIRLWENVNNSDQPPPPPAPTVTAQVSGTLGLNGYYVSDVTVTWIVQSDPAATDFKTIACGPTTINYDTHGAGQEIDCVASNSGGKTTGTVVIKRDASPPYAQIRTNRPSPLGSWTNQDVVVDFLINDTGSSGVNGPGEVKVTVNSEGANQTASITVSDNAGNTTVLTVDNINIDKTPPKLGFRFADLPNGATANDVAEEQAKWHNAPVTMILDPQDNLSGVAQILDPSGNQLPFTQSSPAQYTFTSEGRDSLAFTIIDNAGNSRVVTNNPILIDLTPPTITFQSRLPAANGAGWNNAPVDVTWQCGDSLSGATTPSVRTHMGTEGDGQSAIGTCTDRAGNTASATVGNIRIDLTPPALTFGAQTPPANANGWNSTSVTVPFTVTDSLSGIASTSLSSPLSFTGEGASMTGTVTVTDVAGNTANFTSPAVKIDKTPPTITLVSQLPPANQNGWNNSNITTTWACADSLSGVVLPQLSQTLTTEGANQSLSATCVDLAGNRTGDTRSGLNLDKTPPVIACNPDPAVLWPPNNKMVAVGMTLAFSDALSGTWSYSMNQSASSDGGTGDIDGFVLGSTSLSGSLRAKRSGSADRIYTLGYIGSDLAGNTAVCSTTVEVPHDRSQQQ